MGDETKVDVYKRLTLDLLGSMPGYWKSFEYIRDDLRENDGDVDEQALRAAINELLEETKVEWDERHWEDVYRLALPQEGESLADKVKRLEAERDDALAEVARLRARDGKLIADLKAVDAWTGDGDAETLDPLARRLWQRGVDADGVEVNGAAYVARSLLQDIDRLRAEQAADRAAARALVDALPRCDSCGQPATATYCDGDVLSIVRFCDEHRGDDVPDHPEACGLRVLQARMATWAIDGEHPLRLTYPGAPGEATFLGMTCVAQCASKPPTAPRDVVLLGRSPAAWSDAPVWPQSTPRYVGEFGDIDEPSVGDVDGYGRRM